MVLNDYLGDPYETVQDKWKTIVERSEAVRTGTGEVAARQTNRL